jgi:hypothetical protein
VKCMRCGAELGEGAEPCLACGTSTTTDSPPHSLFQGIAEANRKPKNKLLGMALAVGAIACVAVALFYLVTGDKKQAAANNSSTAPEVVISNSNQSTALVSFPELHFASSGRLPTKLHIFRLGMSIAEAMAEDPDLENSHADGGTGAKRPTSDPEAVLNQRSDRTGFSETASFSHGRLTYITSTVAAITPEDASQFNRNTLVQLGKPDVESYVGPSADAWVTALHCNGVKTIIIEKLDRLARDLMVQETAIADLQKSGFTLISVAEPDLMASDPVLIERDRRGLPQVTPWDDRNSRIAIRTYSASLASPLHPDQAIITGFSGGSSATHQLTSGESAKSERFWLTARKPATRSKLLNGPP